MSTLKLSEAVSSADGCSEWRDILEAYPLATEAYNRAVIRLEGADAAGFNQAWSNAERARKVCEDYRERLFHHRRDHGCLLRSGVLVSR
jgi:hypothetical protein